MRAPPPLGEAQSHARRRLEAFYTTVVGVPVPLELDTLLAHCADDPALLERKLEAIARRHNCGPIPPLPSTICHDGSYVRIIGDAAAARPATQTAVACTAIGPSSSPAQLRRELRASSALRDRIEADRRAERAERERMERQLARCSGVRLFAREEAMATRIPLPPSTPTAGSGSAVAPAPVRYYRAAFQWTRGVPLRAAPSLDAPLVANFVIRPSSEEVVEVVGRAVVGSVAFLQLARPPFGWVLERDPRSGCALLEFAGEAPAAQQAEWRAQRQRLREEEEEAAALAARQLKWQQQQQQQQHAAGARKGAPHAAATVAAPSTALRDDARRTIVVEAPRVRAALFAETGRRRKTPLPGALGRVGVRAAGVVGERERATPRWR